MAREAAAEQQAAAEALRSRLSASEADIAAGKQGLQFRSAIGCRFRKS